MGGPNQTNQQASQVDTEINDVVKVAEGVAEKSIETSLEAAEPILALPIIKQVFEATTDQVVQAIGKDISVSFQEVGTFYVIDTQVSGEEGGISQALANLMLAEKSGNQQQIQEAIAAYAKYQTELIQYNGSAPPVT